MRIKRIEIDGFKSYAQRETIEGFDPSFNAITGLNGSGKSNILDAICFVLGITNLSQVRAAQLQDLVHKQGQAGVTKATVTITFDNTNPGNCPLTYDVDRHPEIVVIIGGRNTFSINGVTATNQRVTDLFRSVGLNVNNPHFLIMQGRITKVLNMKPAEILGMIEEAAGTKMYETKKQNAVKTIEKKDAKVQEINKLLSEDILPQVEKLKSDRADYLEYQKLDREIETLQRKYIAFDYANTQASEAKYEKDIAIKGEEMRSAGERITQLTEKIAEMVSAIESAQRQESGEAKKQLEDAVSARRSERTDVEGARDALVEQLQALRVALERKQRTIATDQADLAKKKDDLAKLEQEQGGEERAGEMAEEEVRRLRAKIEALARGMTTDEQGNAVTLDAQLTAAKTTFSTNETNMKLAKTKLNTFNPTLTKKQKELANIASQSGNDEKEREALQKELTTVDTAMRELNFNEAIERALEEESRKLKGEREKLEEVVNRVETKYPTLRLTYSDPSPTFDRAKVKGVFAKLIRVREAQFCLALQVAAGASMNSVVVADAITGQELIAHGRLNRRVTFIPLDKIESRVIDAGKLKLARQMVGAENVHLARELVDFDGDLLPAVDYVLGRVLICATDAIAKKLAYDHRVNARCVTLGGDDYSPSGTLTGGSRQMGAMMLQDLFDVAEQTTRLHTIDKRLATIADEQKGQQPRREAFNEYRARGERLQRLIDAREESLKQSDVGRLREEIAAITEEIAKQKEVLETGRVENDALKTRITEMEARKQNEKAFQEKERKQAQKELTEAEKTLQKKKGSFERSKNALDTLREEIVTIGRTIGDDENEINEIEKQLAIGKEKLKAQEVLVKEAQDSLTMAEKALQRLLAEYREKDRSRQAMSKEVDSLRKEMHKLQLRFEHLEREQSDCREEKNNSAKKLIALAKKYKWIDEEKKHFGKEGTGYEFTGCTGERFRKELDANIARKEELGRKVNLKAMHMLASAEDQAQQLEGRKQQLERDKQQLMVTIEQLDIKKREEIIRAHEQVNRDFGSIFSSLLPGTSAMLKKPANAASVLEGLEVKVAFNNKWKDSLSELSGGQRSLVALSLVLAMLKFKPAPLYILDEVDAALDLSHTQNIGAMIKSHFKESQFIIVSLKDGMFNNANVLFKTKFIDGTSTVTRSVNIAH